MLKRKALGFLPLLFLLLFYTSLVYSGPRLPTTPGQLRRVNAPYFPGTSAPSNSERAVFWFGEVDSSHNYVDGRVAYNDAALYIAFHVVDHDLWFDTSPQGIDLKEWDSVSLYLDQSGPTSTSPSSSSYRFENGLHNQQDDALYRTVARGDGSDWNAQSLTFTTDTFWRGEGLNGDASDRGWVAIFEIPFSSLGLSSPPAAGTTWGLAVIAHDRDDAAGSSLLSTSWPEESSDLSPASWGDLHFGRAAYTPPAGAPSGSTTIRQGLNGTVVEDAHVGGHTDCGELVHPQFFSNWGTLNYDGYDQINIQNQWDVADWPCFSKYYITFPLASLPADNDILSATLTLHQFGNALPGEAFASFIQVLEVQEPWSEDTISWNNAPMPAQNLDVTNVRPIEGGFAGWPGIPYHWDVTGAVARAYAVGEPVRLVLYSADTAYHSGKYFSSSDVPEWNAEARPKLTVSWSNQPAPEPTPSPSPTPLPTGEPPPSDYYPMLLPMIRRN